MQRAVFLVLMVSLFGCVPAKKYREVVAERDYFKAEYQALSEVEQEKLACQRELRALRAELKEAVHELEVVTVRASALERDNESLRNEYERLLRQNEALLSTASYEKQSLEAQLAAKMEELDRKEAELQALEYVLDQRRQELEALERTLQSRGMHIDRVGQWLSAREAELQSVYAGLEARVNAWAGQPVVWQRESTALAAPVRVSAPLSFFVTRNNRLSAAASNLLNDLRGLTLPFPALAIEVQVPVQEDSFEKDASLLVALAARMYDLGFEDEQMVFVPRVGTTPSDDPEIAVRIVPQWSSLVAQLEKGSGEGQ